MAHFAQIENNIVTKVIVVDNKDTSNKDGIEIEQIGIDFCTNLLGGTWIQTSFNNKMRKNYAGIGYTYNKDLDAFIPPKPFASWLLDETIAQWKAPVDMPTDDKDYMWDEDKQNWIETL